MLHRAKYHLIAIGMMLGVLISLIASPPASAASQQNQVLSGNAWSNQYSWNWADTVKSSLEKLGDGRYERVEWVSDALYVEHYNASYRFLDASKIDASTYTPTGASEVIWGGYYAGSQFNFVVTGQANKNDSDGVVVMRVTKYSKAWSYLGNVEYSAINTYMPFSAGSLRMTEMNGELWIRTCHEMYKSSDGYHHQANMTFRIRQSDLSKLDSATSVSYFGSKFGYVSHSFNQFIVSTGSKIYSADHGDAYPRAIAAKNIPTDSASGSSGQEYYIANFKGKVGNNYTGATLDGFESANNAGTLISVGTMVDQDKSFADEDNPTSGAKNVWIGVTPVNGTQSSVKYLTNYAFDGNTTATNPALVKINENRLLVLWSTRPTNSYSHNAIQYAFIDGQGNVTSQVYSMNGSLSDCQPIVAGNEVVWYATDDSAPTFYVINASNGQSSAHDATQSVRMSFDSQGGSTVPSQDVRIGQKATQPANPTRSGYTFLGWYTAKTGGSKYDFSRGVTSDVTLYAHWDVRTYTVSFDANGGSSVSAQKVKHGSKASQPANPTRSGYAFQGWYTAKTGGSKYDFSRAVTSDVTLYAHWTANPQLKRLAGTVRYDTMSQLVSTAFTGTSSTVIVASGANYPDALAASALAGVKDAPIVLTDPGALSPQAAGQLKRLNPSEIIVAGGANAVSQGVVSSLKGYARNVHRVSGSTRYDTSYQLYLQGKGKWGSTAIVATGSNYADALSVSSYAYAAKAPVFLCDPQRGLTAAQRQALKSFKRVLVVGGENAVPTRYVSGLPGMVRKSGTTRYETSVAVAKWASSGGNGLGMDGVVYATGSDFPDALAAGPLAGRNKGVMLLVNGPDSPTVSYSAEFRGKVSKAWVAGGTNAVSAQTANTIADKLNMRRP